MEIYVVQIYLKDTGRKFRKKSQGKTPAQFDLNKKFKIMGI